MFAAQNLTKDPSLIANAALNFPHLVPEDLLMEVISIVLKMCPYPVNLSLISGIICATSKAAWKPRSLKYFMM